MILSSETDSEGAKYWILRFQLDLGRNNERKGKCGELLKWISFFQSIFTILFSPPFLSVTWMELTDVGFYFSYFFVVMMEKSIA